MRVIKGYVDGEAEHSIEAGSWVEFDAILLSRGIREPWRVRAYVCVRTRVVRVTAPCTPLTPANDP